MLKPLSPALPRTLLVARAVALSLLLGVFGAGVTGCGDSGAETPTEQSSGGEGGDGSGGDAGDGGEGGSGGSESNQSSSGAGGDSTETSETDAGESTTTPPPVVPVELGPSNVYGQVVLDPRDGLNDISRVSVELVLDGEETLDPVELDEDGVFEFEDVPMGEYRLTVTYAGGLESEDSSSAYRPFAARFSIDGPGTANLGRLELRVGVGTISGSVNFGSGADDGEAVVSLRGITRTSEARTSGGEFSFDEVEVGFYTLLVQREGFAACEEEVTVAYHEHEVVGPLSVARKSVSFAPSGGTDVAIDGGVWFLQDSSEDSVAVAVDAPFAAQSRSWLSSDDAPDYDAFDERTAITVSSLPEGETSYSFQFRSECGLESEVFTRTFVRDQSAPIVDFVALNGGITVSRNRTVPLTVAAHDDIADRLEMRVAICDVSPTAVVTCSPELDAASWVPYTFSQSVTFSETSGTKRVQVEVRDPNGNTTATFVADLEYDPDPPSDIVLEVSSIEVGEDNRITTNLPLINVMGVGISEMKVGLSAGLGGVSWQPFQSAFRFEIPGPDRALTLYFRFRDAAGNETSELIVPLILDRTGSVVGRFQLPGQADHSDIQVVLPGPDIITFTDSDGYWSMTGVPAGRYPLVATKTNFREYRIPSIEVVAATEIDVGTVYMVDFQAQIIGNVVLEGFEGTVNHAGATVRLTDEPTITALTDAAGNFTLPAPPVNYPSGLTISKPGFSTFVRTEGIQLQPDATFNLGQIFLTAVSNTLRGTVKRAGEGDHTGIQVRLIAETGTPNEGLELVATTDSIGAYRIDDIPLGEFRISYIDPDSSTRETYNRAGIDVVPGPPIVLSEVVLRDRFIKINDGDDLTQVPEVTVELGATDCLEMQISNLSDFADATWISPCESPVPWTLTAGDGPKTVYARFRTAADPGNPTEGLSDTITLDSGAGLVSFSHDAGGRTLMEGSIVRFTATANEPGQLLEVSIVGYETGIQLFDNGTNGDSVAGDNVWTREFTVSRADDINAATVTAYFTDHAGNTAQLDAAGTFTVAIPPAIYGIQVVTSFGDGTATIDFDTSEPTTAVIEWGTADEEGNSAFENTEPTTSLASSHSVTFGAGTMLPGDSYAVRIVATDALGNQTTSTPRVFALLPSVPERVVAIPGIGRCHVRWEVQNIDNVVGFNVYRSTSPGDLNPTKINATPYNHEAFLYEDTTVTNGTTYYYSVRSVDYTDNESEISNESAATPAAASDGPTSIEGAFLGQQVWSEIHSPYVLEATVRFDDGVGDPAALIVGPGTLIEIPQNERLIVNGLAAMYGQPEAYNEVVRALPFEQTTCGDGTSTYGFALEVGDDLNENGILDDDEPVNRMTEFCNQHLRDPFERPASECDCAGARCVEYRNSTSPTTGTVYETLCMYGDEGRAMVANRTVSGRWSEIELTASPTARHDHLTGQYLTGNVFYQTAFAFTTSGPSSDGPGFAILRSQLRDMTSYAGYVSVSGTNLPNCSVMARNNAFSDGSYIYAGNCRARITDNTFSHDSNGVYVSNSETTPYVNVRVLRNTFVPGYNTDVSPRHSQATVVGRGAFAHNSLSFTSTNLYTNVSGNVMDGSVTHSWRQGSPTYGHQAANNRVTGLGRSGYISGSTYGEIYANVFEHDKAGTGGQNYSTLSNRSQFVGNHYYGSFLDGVALHLSSYNATYQHRVNNNSFFIDDTNSTIDDGLAVLTDYDPASNPPTLNGLDNYWGTVSTVEMLAGEPNVIDATAIHDQQDDGDLAAIDYSGYTQDSFPMPWVTSPESMSGYEPGAAITFSGYGWDEEDAANDGCPAVSPIDDTKACPRDGADYCPPECFLASGNIRWCATEASCSGADQLFLGDSFTTSFTTVGIKTVWMRAYDSGGKFVSVPWSVEIVE